MLGITTQNAVCGSSAIYSNPDTTYVRNITVSGNKALSDNDIKAVISTRENTSYFGFFKPWTGIHRFAEHLFSDRQGAYPRHATLLSTESSVKAWLQESLGEQPAQFKPDDFQRDIALIKKLYTYKGYFNASIDTMLVTSRKDGKTAINITVTENQPARIDTIHHQGLEKLDDRERNAYLSGSAIQLGRIFTVDDLISERDRTIDFFKEHGYALIQEDSIHINIDTIGVQAGIQVIVNLPEQLTYGPLKAILRDPRSPDSTASRKTRHIDGIDIVDYTSENVSDKLISAYTAYRPDQTTKLSLQQATLQNFGATNMFSSVFISRDSVSQGQLHTTLHLEPKPRHLIKPTVYADNRYGKLFVGGKLIYENKNLFSSAENLRVTTGFGVQTSDSNDLLKNLDESLYTSYKPYELGISADLVIPELNHPGNTYGAFLEYNRSRLPILLDNQKGLMRLSYNAGLTANSRVNFDFFELEWVKKDSLDGFRTLFEKDLAENIDVDPENMEAVDSALDSLMQTTLNQTFRLQYFLSNRPDQPRQATRHWNVTLEAVGTLPWLIDRYVDKASYEGFTDNDPQIFGTTYSHFLKLSTNYSFTKPGGENTVTAGRLFMGWMAPFGKAEDTPDERRFYAGGPNSMRGWVFNTLGPGRNSNDVTANLGADIKLEGNLEYRVKFFRVFNQPSGIAVFTDVGNIWDRQGDYGLTLASLYKDIGWDMGIGLRIGSPIGPFRFDFAYKLYDPSKHPEPWVIREWTPGDFTFNFGIGEPF